MELQLSIGRSEAGTAAALASLLSVDVCTVQAVQLVQLRTMMKPTRTTSVDQWDWPLPDYTKY